MKQEDKDLLYRYLCMALPYGVKILHNGWDYDRDCKFSSVETLIGINDRFILTLWKGEKDEYSIQEPLSILDYKPYLRPMSSMTEEEINEFILISDTVLWLGNKRSTCILSIEQMNWLNAHHFDFLGLILKGLAIKVTEENNPYKE